MKTSERAISYKGQKAYLILTLVHWLRILLDVFWYKDMVEIFDLADDDRCELTARNGKHSITMYNTTKSDAGPYLCIAINEQGQCSRHFKLTVKGKTLGEGGGEKED